MKANRVLLCLLLAFGFVLGYEMIPHHHHNGQEIASVSHDHDEHGEHHHHISDIFLAMLHHAGDSNLVDFRGSIDDTSSDPFTFGSSFVILKRWPHNLDQSESWLLRKHSSSCGYDYVREASSLRGPPRI